LSKRFECTENSTKDKTQSLKSPYLSLHIAYINNSIEIIYEETFQLLLLLIPRIYNFLSFFYQFEKLATKTLRFCPEIREESIGMRKRVADSSRVKARMPLNTKYSHSFEATSLPIFSHKGPVTRRCASP